MAKKIFFSLCFIAILLEVAPARPDFKICRKKNGNVPKPGTYCRGYYACKNYIPTEQSCKDEEHFNTNTGRCDSKDLFPCLEKPKYKECPTEKGQFLKPGTDCKIYYDCCNGKPTEKRCKQGTFFDPSKQKCEWSSLYTCIEKPKNKKCPMRNGKYLKPGTNCRKYYNCINGEPEEEQCQKNLLFNPTTETCEPSSDYTCVEKPERKECPTRNGRFLKPGTNCIKYYECVNGEPEIKKCQKNTLFNPTTATCEPSNDYTCVEKPERKECLKRNGRFIKPGTNCRKYYDCVNGEPQVKKCPQDTLFNPETEKCESSKTYVCIESTSTTEKVPSTIVTMFTSPSTDDPGEKTSEETSIPTSTVQQSTTNIGTTPSTLDPDFEKTNTELISTLDPGFEKTNTGELISSTESTSIENHSTEGSTLTYSTINPDIETTSSGDLDISTEMTSNENYSTTSNKITHSTLDPNSEKTNSEDIRISTEMSSVPTPSEITSTSFETRESTSTSPSTTSLPSSTHATDDPISKEDREFPITEPTIHDTSISTIYSTVIEHSTTAAITGEMTSTQQVTSVATKLPETTSTVGETTTPDVESNIMCPEPFGYFPHPTDVHKFVGCNNNIPSVLTCPSNLVYKHKLRRCDYKYIYLP